MVVDGFEVFGFDAVPRDIFVVICLFGDIANKVFDEDGIIVGALGDGLFVGAFKNAVEFAGGAFFDECDEVFDPEGSLGADSKRDVPPLVMGSTVADGFRAGAEGCYGDNEGCDEVEETFVQGCTEADVVIEEAGFTGHGSEFFAEKREVKLGMCTV